MAELDANRQVMVRPGYLVPAVPTDILRRVFGDRTVDPRVELVALVVEYWVHSGATPRLTRNKVLEILPGRIDSRNIYDLISLLAKRGFAEAFFNLTRIDTDIDGAFRAFLLSNAVSIDTIRYYASWNGINPKLFLDGFFYGVLESAATVVVDLVKLVKLVAEMQRAQLRTVLLLTTNVDAGVQSLREQVAVVGQIFDALIKQLDPTRLPAKVIETWRQWNEEFTKHLENLDPFSAGRTLGRIAGDLWQLLTGLLGLLKLLRVGAQLVLRYVPLLLGSVRRIAAEAQIILTELAVLMAAIGKVVINRVAKVGLGILRTLFPPEVLRQLVREGRAFLTHERLSLIPVLEPAYFQAFGAERMGTHFGVLVSDEGRPIFMAAMSERAPAARGVATHSEAMRAIDGILDKLDGLFRDTGPRSARLSVSEAAAKAAAQVLLKQRLDIQLREVLQKVAYEAFAELKRSKGRFFAKELGTLIHNRMAARVVADVAQVAPGVTINAEKKIRTIVKALVASDPELAKADKILNQTIAQTLMRRPDVLDILSIEGKAEARTEKAISKVLAEQFKWKPTTTAGDLQSDLILADTKTRNLVNVDWTASSSLDRFEKVWGTVVDDLGGHFNGNWDTVAEAYRRASKGEIPNEVKTGLEILTRHAVRETVVRQAILEEIFGEFWNVRSHEMVYDGLSKLWKKT
jgi:hypothetical protein